MRLRCEAPAQVSAVANPVLGVADQVRLKHFLLRLAIARLAHSRIAGRSSPSHLLAPASLPLRWTPIPPRFPKSGCRRKHRQLRTGRTNGVWEADEGRIVISRVALRTLHDFATTLLHELGHARSGNAADLTPEFEHALTDLLGAVAANAIAATASRTAGRH